jgi:hypothetical protein
MVRGRGSRVDVHRPREEKPPKPEPTADELRAQGLNETRDYIREARNVLNDVLEYLAKLDVRITAAEIRRLEAENANAAARQESEERR